MLQSAKMGVPAFLIVYMSKTIITIIITAIMAFGIGFFIGYKSVSKTIVYTPQKTQVGTLNLLDKNIDFTETKTSYIPPIFFTTDTIIDTVRIVEDWQTIRAYNYTLFDDKFGKLDLSQDIQFNKIASTSYQFTPITKTIYKEPIFTPFITASYITDNSFTIGAGAIYHNIGLQYNYNIPRQTHQISIIYQLK